jgi:hypothetical protein
VDPPAVVVGLLELELQAAAVSATPTTAAMTERRRARLWGRDGTCMVLLGFEGELAR